MVKFASHLITLHTAVALHPCSVNTIVIIVVPCHDKDNFVSSTGTLVFMDLVSFFLRLTVYYVAPAVLVIVMVWIPFHDE